MMEEERRMLTISSVFMIHRKCLLNTKINQENICHRECHIKRHDLFCLVGLILYVPVTNISVILGRVFLG